MLLNDTMSKYKFQEVYEGCCLKKRNMGTILVYVNNFSDPNILKTILNMISKSPKKIFYFSEATVIDNSIPIGIDDAYKL